MKKILLILTILLSLHSDYIYNGCVLNEQLRIGYTFNNIFCINKHKYFSFNKGIAPLFNTNGKLIKCSCKR